MSGENYHGGDVDEKNLQVKQDRDRLEKRRISDFKALLNQPEARRIFWWLMGEAGTFGASFTENSNRTAFNEGKRDQGILLLRWLNKAQPTAFAQMQREALSEASSQNDIKAVSKKEK